MKLSPEPDWDSLGNSATSLKDSPEELLDAVLKSFTSGQELVRVWGKNGERLGSFTPEWFLALDRKHQLRFITVAKKMHEK